MIKIFDWLFYQIENAANDSEIVNFVNNNEENVMRVVMVITFLTVGFYVIRNYVG